MICRLLRQRREKHSNRFLDLLLTVPFTASPTNAIEMNNAMTSSVELGDNKCKKNNKKSM